MEESYLQKRDEAWNDKNERCESESEAEFTEELKNTKMCGEVIASGGTNLHSEEEVPKSTARVTDSILFCNPCLFDDTEENAVGFCVICVEYMCQGCCRDHKKNKATRNHRIIKDSLPECDSVFRLIKEMTSCSEHPDVQVSHKCEDHGVYVCVMCIAGGHRKCEYVKELQRERTDIDVNAMEVTGKLREIKEKSQLVVKSREKNMETLIKEKNEIQKTNAALLQEVFHKLSLLEQDAIIKSEKVAKSELSYLRRDVDICNELEKEVFMFAQLLDAVKQHYSSTEIDIITNSIQTKISEIDRMLEKQQQKGETHLLFKQNTSLSTVHTLGHLKVCLGDTSDENKTQGIEGSSDEIVDQDDLLQASSEKKRTTGEDETNKKQEAKTVNKPRKSNKKAKKYSVRASGDTNNCYICGVVFLQDGRVVAIDKENRKIKIFNSGDLKLSCSHSVDAQPVDICNVGPKHFAVVYKDTKLIDRYIVEDKTVNVERSWKTKYENAGITMDRNLYAVLCKAYNNNVVNIRIQIRRDTDCKVLLEASIYEGGQGELDTDGCSICSTGDEIVVSSANLGISIFRRNNVESLENIRTLNAYDDTTLDLRGLTSDKDGNLYVCSPTSRSVYQIAAKDFSIMKPVASGIDGPMSVTVSKKNDKIIVGCQNDNYLHLFYMKQ